MDLMGYKETLDCTVKLDVVSKVNRIHGSQLAKIKNEKKKKSIFLACRSHKIFRVEAINLKKFQRYFKNHEFVKFEPIS